MKRALFLSLAAAPLWGAVNGMNDVQLWLGESARAKISERVWSFVSNEWRFGDDISRLYHFYVLGMIGFHAAPWLDIAPGYRQNWVLRGTKWRNVYEPFVDFLLEKRVGRVRLQFRNRAAYLIREAEKNGWQERVRGRVLATWNVKKRDVSPYFAAEVFFVEDEGFNQARLQAGTMVSLAKPLYTDFYYMLRFLERPDGWTRQHVFGAWFNFLF